MDAKRENVLPFPNIFSEDNKYYILLKIKECMNKSERNLSYFGEAWDEQLDFDILVSLFRAIPEHTSDTFQSEVNFLTNNVNGGLNEIN